MSEYQVTFWREIPSLVAAREGDVTAKVSLPQRFQEAIDEAAMRAGAADADAYLAGWDRGPWTAGDGSPADLAASVAERLETDLDAAALTALVDGYGEPVA